METMQILNGKRRIRMKKKTTETPKANDNAMMTAQQATEEKNRKRMNQLLEEWFNRNKK